MRIRFDAYSSDEDLTSEEEKQRIDQTFAQAVTMLKECTLYSPHAQYRIKTRYYSTGGEDEGNTVTHIEFRYIPLIVWWRYIRNHYDDQWKHKADDEWKPLCL